MLGAERKEICLYQVPIKKQRAGNASVRRRENTRSLKNIFVTVLRKNNLLERYLVARLVRKGILHFKNKRSWDVEKSLVLSMDKSLD